VVVWGSPEIRGSLTALRDLLIDTPGGGHARLGDVAKVHVVQAPSVKRHESVRSYLDIRAPVKGRALDSVAGEIERRLQSVEFPREYHAQVLGDYAARQAAQDRLSGFTIAAVIGAFLLLQAAFGSWRLASVAFFTFASFLVGGVLAVFASGGIISIGSLSGLLAVTGIAVRNGIQSVHSYRRLEQLQEQPAGRGLVLRGAQERLSPILMTAFATGLAVLPFVVFGDIAGQEVERPMAVVILGGLLTSTLLNLFVVPAMYLIFGESPAQPEASARYAALRPVTVGSAPAD